MLEAERLTVWRGHARLFAGLSFHVPPGRALLLRGANGAGKTTLLRVLCGLTRPEEGHVKWNGEVRPGGLRGLVAYGGHQPALNADLTVRQNLAFYAALQGDHAAWAGLLAPLGLARCESLEVRQLSAGQKRRAGLARVLMSAAPVWLLDEPLTNLDVAGRGYIEERIRAHLQANGIAVIAVHEDIRLGDERTDSLVLAGNG